MLGQSVNALYEEYKLSEGWGFDFGVVVLLQRRDVHGEYEGRDMQGIHGSFSLNPFIVIPSHICSGAAVMVSVFSDKGKKDVEWTPISNILHTELSYMPNTL